MKLSLVIPTFRRPDTLVAGLKSLQNQTLANFEILVVDNAAEPAVEQLVQEFNRTARVTARYIPEPRLGLHYARHAGARAATGEILVFTDDDATFDPGWLQAYAEAFTAHQEMAAAGGPVRPIWESPPPQWLLDYMLNGGKSTSRLGPGKMFTILSLMEPYDYFCIDKRGFFFGVNMAIRRDVLFQVEGFNIECFGNIWLGDGETGLQIKLWNRGMLIGYIPKALVNHHIPTERMTVEYFTRRWENDAGAESYQDYHGAVPSRVRTLRLAFWMIRNNWRIILLGRRLKGHTDKVSLDLQLDAARKRAQVKYLIRLSWDSQFRSLVQKSSWLSQEQNN